MLAAEIVLSCPRVRGCPNPEIPAMKAMKAMQVPKPKMRVTKKTKVMAGNTAGKTVKKTAGKTADKTAGKTAGKTGQKAMKVKVKKELDPDPITEKEWEGLQENEKEQVK